MPDYYAIRKFVGKKGPATYKAAKANKGYKNKYSVGQQKPSQRDNLAKKVKKIASKMIPNRKKRFPGPAAHSTYGGNDA